MRRVFVGVLVFAVVAWGAVWPALVWMMIRFRLTTRWEQWTMEQVLGAGKVAAVLTAAVTVGFVTATLMKLGDGRGDHGVHMGLAAVLGLATAPAFALSWLVVGAITDALEADRVAPNWVAPIWFFGAGALLLFCWGLLAGGIATRRRAAAGEGEAVAATR